MGPPGRVDFFGDLEPGPGVEGEVLRSARLQVRGDPIVIGPLEHRRDRGTGQSLPLTIRIGGQDAEVPARLEGHHRLRGGFVRLEPLPLARARARFELGVPSPVELVLGDRAAARGIPHRDGGAVARHMDVPVIHATVEQQAEERRGALHVGLVVGEEPPHQRIGRERPDDREHGHLPVLSRRRPGDGSVSAHSSNVP